MWRGVRRALGRYQELILAGTFLGMAGDEAAEMWILEGSRIHTVPLGVLVHSLQVGP